MKNNKKIETIYLIIAISSFIVGSFLLNHFSIQLPEKTVGIITMSLLGIILYTINFRNILRELNKNLKMYLLTVFSVIISVILSLPLFIYFNISYHISPALLATYIGGTLNFLNIIEIYNFKIDQELINSTLFIDLIVTYLYSGIILAFFIVKGNKIKSKDIIAPPKKCFRTKNIFIALIYIVLNYIMQIFIGNLMLSLVITIALSVYLSSKIKLKPDNRYIIMSLIIVLFFAIGNTIDIKNIALFRLDIAIILSTIIIVHFSLLIIFSSLFSFVKKENDYFGTITIISLSCIGGLSIAILGAISIKRFDLVPLAIAVSSFGYIVGAFLGIAFAEILIYMDSHNLISYIGT